MCKEFRVDLEYQGRLFLDWATGKFDPEPEGSSVFGDKDRVLEVVLED